MPAMSADQEAAWHALLDLHERVPRHWTLVGGQMVHLWCAERGWPQPRPTDDADAVVDVRADPNALATFTGALLDLGFTPEISGDGLQRRWVRNREDAAAQIDVLLPDGIGERSRDRIGAGGAPTLSTDGGTQALARSADVTVQVGQHIGGVRRPSLFGALVMKAAAHGAPQGSARGRHRLDFALLATLLARRDVATEDVTRKDGQRLRTMIAAVRSDVGVMAAYPQAREALEFLEGALR
jgi:hypothetical protein